MLSQTGIKETLYKALKELGLSEHEITLYTLSLSSGPSTITKLAELMVMPRPNVYKVIEALEKHGLAKFAEQKRRKKTFMVEPPTTVSELLRGKRESLGELDRSVINSMPDLLALYRQGELPTSVKIIENEEQYLKIFDQIIEEENEVSEFFGSTQDFINFISWEKERNWIQRRVKKGIQMKVLTTLSKDAQTLNLSDSKELRETRILNGTSPFSTSFQLYANKVIIWQPKAPLAILITDQYIVEMLRATFYFVWNRL